MPNIFKQRSYTVNRNSLFLPPRPRIPRALLPLRHVADGEPVRQLAREAGISLPGFYKWVSTYKAAVLAQRPLANMSPETQLLDESTKLKSVKTGIGGIMPS